MNMLKPTSYSSTHCIEPAYPIYEEQVTLDKRDSVNCL